MTVTKKPATQGPTRSPKPRNKTYTYWLTRNSNAEGVVSPKIKVWTAQPDRVPCGKGVVWMVDDDERDYFGEWSIEPPVRLLWYRSQTRD